MKKIVYIGNKPKKGDNVAGTGLTWNRGEVLEVSDDKQADILLSHSTVWADADKPYELVDELRVVRNSSTNLIAKSIEGSLDNFVLSLPAELVEMLHAGDQIPVFMTPEDADLFREWRNNRKLNELAQVQSQTEVPPETSPQKENKKGLEKKSA